MSSVAYRLQWKIRALNLLRRTFRPVSKYPGSILNDEEVRRMEEFYNQGSSPKSFCRFLRDREKGEV